MSFLAVCLFVLAYYVDRRFRTGFLGGMFPLLIGCGASAVLWASELSRTMLGWMDRGVVPLSQNLSGVFGEATPASLIYAVICAAGFFITLADLKVDKTYNPWAMGSLVITPPAVHGAQDGWIPWLIDAIHGFVAWVVVPIVGGAMGA